jgi:hydroxymethylglutaryl-CoA lyase
MTNGSRKDAYKAGCIRYDGAIQGFGAQWLKRFDRKYATEKLLSYFTANKVVTI